MPFYKWTSSRFDTVLAIGFIFVMAIAMPSYADEVTLRSGDIIHGKVLEQDDNGILFEHLDLGKMRITKDRIVSVVITSVEPTPPSELPEDKTPTPLADQPKVEDEPAPIEQAEIKTSPPAAVEIITPPPTTEPEMGPPAPSYLVDQPAELTKLNAFVARARENGWSSSLDLSAISETGNTDEKSLRFGATLDREYDLIKYKSDLSYYKKDSDGENTDDKLTFGLTRDSAIKNSDWFTFLMGRYDYDVFESWRHRLGLHGGWGYNLIQTRDFRMDLRAGPGIRKEWGSDTTDLEAEGVIGSGLKWRPTARQTFSSSIFYYALLTDTSDYRTRIRFDWNYLLSDEINLSFFLGLLHEYQSVVDPGKEDTDTRFHTGFRFKF